MWQTRPYLYLFFSVYASFQLHDPNFHVTDELKFENFSFCEAHRKNCHTETTSMGTITAIKMVLSL